MSDCPKNKTSPTFPKVSVLMPVYNGEQHLKEAVDSILSQTFKDFELIVVNDGSKDRTADILAGYSDPRVIVLCNDGNQGIAYSMNRALYSARGQYIARLDGDDVALPERLAIHVRFLDSHTDSLFASAGVNLINEHGAYIGRYCPAISAAGIAWTSFFKMPIANPTLIFRRKEIVDRGIKHSADYPTADDYVFLNEVLKLGSGMALADTLVDYRIHSGSTSVFRRPEQIEEGVEIALTRILDVFPELKVLEGEFRNLIYAAKTKHPLSRCEAHACINAVDVLFRRFVVSVNYLSRWQEFRLRCWTSAFVLRALMFGGGILKRPVLAFGFLIRKPTLPLEAVIEVILRGLFKTPR